MNSLKSLLLNNSKIHCLGLTYLFLAFSNPEINDSDDNNNNYVSYNSEAKDA